MKSLDLVPLREAVLCANCEQIGLRKDAGRCAACGSSAVLMLCRVLGCLSDQAQTPVQRVRDALPAGVMQWPA